MEHQNAGAFFQNLKLQENLHQLPIPSDFDDEKDFLQRYEIFGIIFKFIFPLREVVTAYKVTPNPEDFDVVFGIHLRHFDMYKTSFDKLDSISCDRFKSLFESTVSSEKCAWFIGTERIESEEVLRKCATQVGCTPLTLTFEDRRMDGHLKDEGDVGRRMGLATMHALSVYSTHLVTTQESSFSKLIAELWVANKGVSATMGKWWVVPRDPFKNEIFRPHQYNYEWWEAGHPKSQQSTTC